MEVWGCLLLFAPPLQRADEAAVPFFGREEPVRDSDLCRTPWPFDDAERADEAGLRDAGRLKWGRPFSGLVAETGLRTGVRAAWWFSASVLADEAGGSGTGAGAAGLGWKTGCCCAKGTEIAGFGDSSSRSKERLK